MFDKLVDKLIEWLGLFRFWVVLTDYEGGVILRLGKYHRTCGPGWHWVWPFNIEELVWDTVVTNTSNLGAQSLTTKDGASVVLSAVVTWRITDIKTYLLDIEGRSEAMSDVCYGVIASFVQSRDWAQIAAPNSSHEVTKVARRRAGRYGIEIDQIQFSDLQRCRSVRLWNQAQ